MLYYINGSNSKHSGPIIQGIFGLIIWALSVAISKRVGPKDSQWSNPIEVTMLKIGLHMLTASNFTPKPPSATYFTYFTKISTFWSLKYIKPAKVTFSK